MNLLKMSLDELHARRKYLLTFESNGKIPKDKKIELLCIDKRIAQLIETPRGDKMDWNNILEHLGMEQANLYARFHGIDPPFGEPYPNGDDRSAEAEDREAARKREVARAVLDSRDFEADLYAPEGCDEDTDSRYGRDR